MWAFITVLLWRLREPSCASLSRGRAALGVNCI